MGSAGQGRLWRAALASRHQATGNPESHLGAAGFFPQRRLRLGLVALLVLALAEMLLCRIDGTIDLLVVLVVGLALGELRHFVDPFVGLLRVLLGVCPRLLRQVIELAHAILLPSRQPGPPACPRTPRLPPRRAPMRSRLHAHGFGIAAAVGRYRTLDGRLCSVASSGAGTCRGRPRWGRSRAASHRSGRAPAASAPTRPRWLVSNGSLHAG